MKYCFAFRDKGWFDFHPRPTGFGAMDGLQFYHFDDEIHDKRDIIRWKLQSVPMTPLQIDYQCNGIGFQAYLKRWEAGER